MDVPYRQVRARYGADTVTVYQAYGVDIAAPALAAGRFVSPFKRDRMTWIKPSFLWMMYRCGWASKPGQERVRNEPRRPGVCQRGGRVEDGGVVRRQTKAGGDRVIASNRRALHEYEILRRFEAGIVLVGTEVKSVRDGRASLVDAFAQERDGEIVLYGLHIAEYGYGSWTNHQPRRARKLLLHRREIDRMLAQVRDAGVTLVPLSLYLRGGWVKVEVGLARGRRAYDKRQALAQRDAEREIARELSRRLKGRAGRGRRGSGAVRGGHTGNDAGPGAFPPAFEPGAPASGGPRARGRT